MHLYLYMTIDLSNRTLLDLGFALNEYLTNYMSHSNDMLGAPHAFSKL